MTQLNFESFASPLPYIPMLGGAVLNNPEASWQLQIAGDLIIQVSRY
jgi:hypothetical protein